MGLVVERGRLDDAVVRQRRREAEEARLLPASPVWAAASAAAGHSQPPPPPGRPERRLSEGPEGRRGGLPPPLGGEQQAGLHRPDDHRSWERPRGQGQGWAHGGKSVRVGPRPARRRAGSEGPPITGWRAEFQRPAPGPAWGLQGQLWSGRALQGAGGAVQRTAGLGVGAGIFSAAAPAAPAPAEGTPCWRAGRRSLLHGGADSSGQPARPPPLGVGALDEWSLALLEKAGAGSGELSLRRVARTPLGLHPLRGSLLLSRLPFSFLLPSHLIGISSSCRDPTCHPS